MPNISIQRTSLNTLSQSDLKQQYELLIHAYAETEKEIWGDNYVRVSLEEYKQDIENETVFNKLHTVSWEKEHEITSNFKLQKRQQFFSEIKDNNAFDLIYFDAFGARVQPELWSKSIFELLK